MSYLRVKCKVKVFGFINEKHCYFATFATIATSHLYSITFKVKGKSEIMICIFELMLTLPGIAFPLMSAFMTAVKTKKNKH